MLVNVAVKTLSIFNQVPKSIGRDYDEYYSENNPLYTWYARHFVVDRKKVLILVNGQTLLTVFVTDVNAKNKTELAVMIKDAISEALEQCGIQEKEINAYFQKAGEIEVGAAVNRPVSGIITDHLNMIRYDQGSIIINQMTQPALVDFFKHDVTGSQKIINEVPEKGIRMVFAKDLPDLKIKTVFEAQTIERTWTSFAHWQSLSTEERVLNTQNESEIIDNNDLCIAAFVDYLTHTKKSSPKVVKRNQKNIDYIINSIILEKFVHLPTEDLLDLYTIFSEEQYFDSATDLSHMRTAARQFYTFLALTGEITEDEKKEAHDAIKTGIEFLKMNDDFLFVDWQNNG